MYIFFYFCNEYDNHFVRLQRQFRQIAWIIIYDFFFALKIRKQPLFLIYAATCKYLYMHLKIAFKTVCIVQFILESYFHIQLQTEDG